MQINNSSKISNTQPILEKLNAIVRGEMLQNTQLEWIEDAINSGKFWRFSTATQNELIDTVFLLAQNKRSDLHSRALDLYEKIMHILEISKAKPRPKI